ncbi:nucleotidyltransferase family protein [Streptomyces albus]|uniref:nucleotidyltransferase family protein n=1 Tax=Streptomyces albus TaxID=1888 RepID=UPI000A8C6AAF|nr:nucleotidyltransferase family protein [Streptomyces albus]
MNPLDHDAGRDSSVRALRAAMTWAAGAPGAPPALTPEHLPRVLELLDAHRLDARFLRRVDAEGPRTFGDDLVRRVRERQEHTAAGVARRIALARRVADRLRRDGAAQVLVPVKGFTLYGRTGDPAHLRRSGDLDIVSDEPQQLVDVLTRDGFVPEGELDILDEYCRLRSPDGQLVEVHSHVRVPRLPDGVGPSDCDPRRHPGDWLQPWHLETYHLGQKRLAELMDTGDNAAGLPLLRPEPALLAQVCHAFGDYVTAAFPLPAATVRLDEIAAGADYAALPDFRPGLLAELTAETGAHDAVAFFRSMAVALLGTDPLAGAGLPGSCEPRAFFPVDAWWDGVDGYVVDRGWDPGQLLVRDRTAIPALLDRFDAPAPELLAPGDTHRVTAPGGGAAGRSVHRAVPGHAFDVEARLTRTSDGGLTVVVSLPAAGPGEFSALSLNFGDYRYECFHEPDGDRFRHDDYSLTDPGGNGFTTRFTRGDGRDVFEAHLPRTALGAPEDGVVPLLLGARHQRAGWGRMLGGAVLPLRLRLPERPHGTRA